MIVDTRVPGTWVIDLDGVIWLAGEAIEGGAAAIEAIRRAGHSVLFATNNSAPTEEQLLARLDRVGITAQREEIVTAAHAAVSLVPKGASVHCIGDGGVREALDRQGIDVVDEGGDVVIVGWTATFDYDTLDRAARAARSGALFIGTNPDPTHPTPTGLRPGTGALIAAVEVASGRKAIYAGKPNGAMASLITARAQDVAIVVGDQVATDGALALRLGVPFGHVSSGVDARATEAAISAPSFAALVETVLFGQ